MYNNFFNLTYLVRKQNIKEVPDLLRVSKEVHAYQNLL